jgi:hypothetical protein
MATMRTLARSGLVLGALVAATACTVERTPDAGPSPPTPPPSASASSGRPCPWSELHGQEYEAETGRIRLVVTCLGDQDRTGDGGGWAHGGPLMVKGGDDRSYTDGTTAAVLCVEPMGAGFADSAGHVSKVWFKIHATFAGGDADGWVPHAATGYAAVAGQEICRSF